MTNYATNEPEAHEFMHSGCEPLTEFREPIETI